MADAAKNEDSLPLPPLEMLKSLGVWSENPQVSLPMFTNHLEVTKIAREICDRFSGFSTTSTSPADLESRCHRLG